MTYMQEQEIQSIVTQAQSQGIDVYEILSKREYAFLNGSFVPNNNYACQLRHCIKRKIEKALGNPKGQTLGNPNETYNTHDSPNEIPRGRGLAWYASSLGRSRSPVQIRPTPLNYKQNTIPQNNLHLYSLVRTLR